MRGYRKCSGMGNGKRYGNSHGMLNGIECRMWSGNESGKITGKGGGDVPGIGYGIKKETGKGAGMFSGIGYGIKKETGKGAGMFSGIGYGIKKKKRERRRECLPGLDTELKKNTGMTAGESQKLYWMRDWIGRRRREKKEEKRTGKDAGKGGRGDSYGCKMP